MTTPTFRHTVYNLLEAADYRSSARRAVDVFLTTVILLNGAVYALETVEPFAAVYHAELAMFDYFTVALFTAEFLIRVWVTPEHPETRYHHPLYGRLRFVATFFSLIDLAAILPFYLSALSGIDLRFMRIFRLIRILRFSYRSPSILALAVVMRKEAHNLAAAMVLLLLLLFVSSVLMYHLEKDAQPDKFINIPASMWWAVATLTTVGFGDLVPVTPLGKLFGGVVMFVGIVMFALPAGMLASAFVEEIKGKSFIATWKMVAKVPFFTQLDAVKIAEIAERLLPRTALPGERIFAVGQKARCMYFIASGEVEVVTKTATVTLTQGDFFGEMGLLDGARRNADVRAQSYVELLCLEDKDFHVILTKYPEIRKIIEEEAARRRQ